MEAHGTSDSGNGSTEGNGPTACQPAQRDGLHHFRIRTGCQWNHIPRIYGGDSTIHRTFQHWVEIDLFPQLWALLLEECEEFGLVDWEWQAADSAMGKAGLGGDEVGPNPTDRAKNGPKKSILTDRTGGPLAVVVAGDNVIDAKLLEQTIEAIVVDRPKPTQKKPQHLCLDKGYDNPNGEAAVDKHHYTGHIRRIGEEKLSQGKKVSGAPLGRGKNVSMVIQMSWPFDPLREKGEKLSGTPASCLCFALVSPFSTSYLLR